jgi:hypothetical protein
MLDAEGAAVTVGVVFAGAVTVTDVAPPAVLYVVELALSGV